MNLVPKTSLKTKLLVAALVVGVIYANLGKIGEARDNIGTTIGANSEAFLGILVLAIAAYWFQNFYKGRLTAQLEDAGKVLQWCCRNSPTFREKWIGFADINPHSWRHLKANNRLIVNFQFNGTGLWNLVRVDPAFFGYDVSLFMNGMGSYVSMEMMEKLCRPDMTYEAAKAIVKKTEEEFEEKKEEV